MENNNDDLRNEPRHGYTSYSRRPRRCYDNRHQDRRMWMGVAIIMLGVALLGDNLNFLSYDLRRYIFTWENILILLGLVFILGREKRSAGIIMVIVGGVFYMKNVLNIINFDFWSIFWPGMLILAGVMIIFRHRFDRNPEKKTLIDDENIMDEMAVFGGGDRVITSQHFKGGKVTTVFGGLNFNMLKAKLEPGENVIDVFCLFGGMKLIVPEGWTVKIRVMSLFGGFSDKHRYKMPETNSDLSSQLIIKGTVIFGGGEIKSYFD